MRITLEEISASRRIECRINVASAHIIELNYHITSVIDVVVVRRDNDSSLSQ